MCLQRVGRFEITGELGSGSMGQVLSAIDPQLHRRVALKLIHEGSLGFGGERARMLSEARAMAKLNHTNVVKVFEAGIDDGQVYLAMEEIDGGTLRQYLRSHELGWRDIISLFIDAGRGLAAAHAMGLVHRDFKTDNVLVGSDGRVCVSDFGLVGAPIGGRVTASALGGPETQLDLAVGTPVYMAPEQHSGAHFDERADQFAFCVSLWEALYGRLPFRGKDRQAYFDATCTGDVDIAQGSDVPSWVRDILLRGLSADPERRFGCMSELLAEFAEDQLRPIGRHWSLVALLIALVGSPSLGMFLEPSFARLASVVAVATLICAVLLWRVRDIVWRNAFNRRVTSGTILALASMVIAGAGLAIFGAPPATSRIVNPLIAGVVFAVFALAVEKRAAAPIGIYALAFMTSALRLDLAPLAFSIANALTITVLVVSWRTSPRAVASAAVGFERARSSPTLPVLPRLAQVGRFSVLGRISSEARGDLFEAYDPELQRHVTLWLGDSAQSSPTRHPNIATVFESGDLHGHAYSVMEPLSGRTIATELATPVATSWEAVVARFAAAGRGLAAAHARGIVHRAFSASYCFIDDDEVRVGGFRADLPRWGQTRSLLAPELISGQPATPASDQFSFCAAMWSALVADPFVGDSQAAYLASVAAGPARGSRLAPSWLRASLARGMSADPRDRFADMDALLSALLPAPRDFGPGRRLWGYLILVLPIAAALPLALKGFSPAEDALGFGTMAAVNLAALVPLLLVCALTRSHLISTLMSRTLFGAFGVGIGATLLLIAGGAAGDLAPRLIELLHLAVWAAVVGALALLHDRRLWPAATALALAFLAAAAAPTLIYLWILVAIAFLTINLAATLRD